MQLPKLVIGEADELHSSERIFRKEQEKLTKRTNCGVWYHPELMKSSLIDCLRNAQPLLRFFRYILTFLAMSLIAGD